MSLREKKTKPKTLRTGGRNGGSNFAEGRAEVRGAGKMGRAGSEGGVREPGGSGTSGASLPGAGWGPGYPLVRRPAESALRGHRRRVREVGA